MNYYTLVIHTQQGTLTYNVAVPMYDAKHNTVDIADMLTSDEPVALDTVGGSMLIVQPINAVAVEIVHTPPPQNI